MSASLSREHTHVRLSVRDSLLEQRATLLRERREAEFTIKAHTTAIEAVTDIIDAIDRIGQK
ncbi:hypothetical protein PBI_MRMAGOO_87 [Mycobacterium phage MrMagoo]|uniref:Uncharacterized protein n=1 Tax=Mycobacterium phage MrMagoo TaxID=1927020 RepID=A0A1L6BYL4_9CAUD|nr:hypothetical protein J4U04_gp087 [Mycobacterium phage MrMagoo]APQ42190.1 hypothetical protein PBI_MRMAGOO_87 [Mycobacterium phage MrMagoo]ARM70265.1 hypothetical protein SEA_GARDENSALSA_87 [Mycobacterium phage GardenSalsa]